MLASTRFSTTLTMRSTMLMLSRQLNSSSPTTSGAKHQQSEKQQQNYTLVVVGGGSGGMSVAAKFAPILGAGKTLIVEPSDTHYYQPLWTLVGGGLASLEATSRPMETLIPSGAKWAKTKVVEFQPEKNSVKLGDGSVVSYDYLVVAVGIELAFDKVKGLTDALFKSPSAPGVCSNYSSQTVLKTFEALKSTTQGTAIFTQPTNPIKCAGAPQKIAYLADDYWRKSGQRDKIKMIFNTALPSMLSAPKYAAVLKQLATSKNIAINFQHNLVEVNTTRREAIFERLDTQNKERVTVNYDFLHVTPPMVAPKVLAPLADQAGYCDVNKETLQHVKYANIFSLGDCSNLPTSKTAAAAAAECGVLAKNLKAVMDHKKPVAKYDGYTSCPVVTGGNKCILAEFDYTLEPLETFPFDQRKARRVTYYVKRDLVPHIYWNYFLKGKWVGPGFVRKALHLGFSK